MMYYKALVEGLSPVPTSTPEVRAKVQAMADEQGWPALHQLLAQYDPPLYEKLAPNDKQRVARALEVYFLTGRSMSSFLQQPKEACPFTRLELVLLPKNNDRTHLREVIYQRFVQMLEQEHGLLEETQVLLERGIDPNAPAMRAVGYRQAAMYLKGEVSYEQMIELGVIATARLAKHQMTWLRGGLKGEDSGGKANAAATKITADTMVTADATERHYLWFEDPHKQELALHIIKSHPRLWAYARA